LEQPEERLAQAILAVKKGRKAEAEKLLKAVIQKAPQNADGWLWLGAAVSSPAETLYCLERVLEIEPDNPRAQAGIQWAKAQINPQQLVTPDPPLAPSVSPQSMPRPKGQTESWLGYARPGEPLPAPEPAIIGQSLPAPAATASDTAPVMPGHVPSYFFPNLIIAVLALTLVLGLLIIVALLRAYLSG